MDRFYKDLGIKIKKIRERMGLSQEELAKKLGVNRVAVSQIETGDRKISAEEITKVAKVFNIPTDVLLNIKKDIEVVFEKSLKKAEHKEEIRISVPQKNLKKFKEVLIYILEKVGSKPNIGETVLYKLLYFMDFNFYEKYEEQLMGATYIKNHHGPTPKEFIKIVEEMIENEEVVKVQNKYFQHLQKKYLPLRKPDLSLLSAREKETIDDVLNSRLSDMNATQISDYSHGDVPWESTEDGEIIEYESVFYRKAPYSVREYAE
ncbi:MAG: helix-turn-helix domain-containing protein [Candidatus Omnitrophica bacterium]|nr:helix-turn-helix domain-containing protein [Candidatus Omnitrophota bacterium]MDD5488287.1 helix-turn-helix domain-containing protein [Candidatus Omnitrophota bacterium]